MKKMSLENISEIVTHDGVFHADEVFACALMQSITYAMILRTRKKELIIPQPDRVLIDVGDKYNPEAGQFDHHQRDEKGKREPRANGIPYSGFGLIWEAYGKDYIKCFHPTLEKSEIEEVWKRVDQQLVCGIDATDCGVKLSETKAEYVGYGALTVSAAILLLNPTWMEKRELEEKNFLYAVTTAKIILDRQVSSVVGSVVAQEKVKKEIEKRAHHNILILNQFMPWQETVIQNEDILYVIFEDKTDKWMVQAVPELAGSFKCRKPFPKEWGGLREEELRLVTGVEDAKFCHVNLFLCGAESLKGAVELAKKALGE